MARIRYIKPGFFTNDELGALPPLARLLFAGLWTIADRDGRLEDRPRRIKAEVLPYDDVDVDEMLAVLHNADFIIRYSHDRQALIQIRTWGKHQSPHVKESASTIPAPDKHDTSTPSNGEWVMGNGELEGEQEQQLRPPPLIFRLYEQVVSAITPHMADVLRDAELEYEHACIEHSFAEAAELNKRSWRYVEAILRRHKAEGCFAGEKKNGAKDPDVDWMAQRYERKITKASTG